jgi:hypothetical protein
LFSYPHSNNKKCFYCILDHSHRTKTPIQQKHKQKHVTHREKNRWNLLNKSEINFFIANPVPRPVPGWGTNVTYQVTP